MAQTYWGLIHAAAQNHPARVVLVDDYGRSLTNSQLHDAAERTAAALFERGVTRGTVAPEVLDHTVGRPVPGVSIRVVDENESEVGVGEEGELRLKGPQCFLGYVDASLDADAFDADGWFRTGDRGRIDRDGNVAITGRIKDAIIRNAENISALEIEGVLASHPAVDDVAVIGVPDPRTGERVCAVVVATTDVTLSDLAKHCQDLGLSKHKSPERLEVVDELPRNLTGKVLKNELRARFAPR